MLVPRNFAKTGSEYHGALADFSGGLSPSKTEGTSFRERADGRRPTTPHGSRKADRPSRGVVGGRPEAAEQTLVHLVFGGLGPKTKQAVSALRYELKENSRRQNLGARGDIVYPQGACLCSRAKLGV